MTLSDGPVVTGEFYRRSQEEELAKLGGCRDGHYRVAAEIMDTRVLTVEFVEFLTIPTYDYID